MTLFRKVFQNQSRPACEEDTIDEESLRAAFMEMDTDQHPLDLDPFEYVLDEELAADAASSEDCEDSGLSSDIEIAEAESSAQLSQPSEEVDTADRADANDAEDKPDDAEATGVVVQSDEEIAACLDRALAADPDAEPEDTTAQAELLDDDADELADIDLSDLAADTPQPPAPETVVAQDETDKETKSEPLDVNAFALAQIKAAEAKQETDFSQSEEVPGSGQAGAVTAGSLDAVPAPATGRAGRRVGRVKTRLLGFNRSGEDEADPFCRAHEATAKAQSEKYPVGWLVIVEGPGEGHSFSIFTGASMIGRGEDQVIRLDFGDNSISRQNHAAIAYDEEQNKFFVGHGGKSNIIRRNARPVLSTEELHHADLIRIGETTLRFVALCGSDFQWSSVENANADGV